MKKILVLVVSVVLFASCQVTSGPDSVEVNYAKYSDKIENAHEFNGMSDQEYESCLDLLKKCEFSTLDRVLRNY